MDATALSISVSAKAKRYTGKKDPIKAEIEIHFHCDMVSLEMLLKPIRTRNKDANIILKEPNCKASRPINPFFISIKELPQTKESRIR